MIYIAGITIAVFVELLLLGKKNKSLPDKILACWMFLIILHFFLFYLLYSGSIIKFPLLWGLELPLPLLHGVFLYFYTAALTNQLPQKRIIVFFHFVPAAAMYIYLIPFLLLPVEQKAYVYKNSGAGYEVFTAIRFFAVVLAGIVYVAWSFLLLRKHQHRILNQFSYDEKINLKWLRFLTAGTGVIWLLILFFDSNNTIIFGGVVLFVFLMGLFGIRQGKIFDDKKELPEENKKPKYSKSGLTEELAESLYKKLICLMKEEKLYCKNNLSVNDLAARLNVHPNYLSQVINETEGKNFYDFVNYYRIEEFKRVISDPENRNLTLLAVAFHCGFNSKSSFNRHFKKTTGQTPSRYLLSQTSK